jgi:thiamine pyrophosphokinase
VAGATDPNEPDLGNASGGSDVATAAVFLGGPHPGVGEVDRLGIDADLVVAVDSGLHLAVAAGHRVDVVIGDMDSVEPAQLDRAELDGVEVVRHPVDKDETDLELALELLLGRGCDDVVIVGADGGRMDHLLGGALTIAAPRFARMRISAWFGRAHLLPVHDERELPGSPAQLVSLVPTGGVASGVTTAGLRWPLRDAVLVPGTSWGLSNEFVGPVAHISVDAGCVVAIIPEEEPLS